MSQREKTPTNAAGEPEGWRKYRQEIRFLALFVLILAGSFTLIAWNPVNDHVIEPFTGLIVDFARDHGVSVLVRGVRTVGDFDYEKQMAVMNRDLYPKLDTVMLVPSPEHAHLSSSLVREIASLGADIDKFVPAPVVPLLRERFGKKKK